MRQKDFLGSLNLFGWWEIVRAMSVTRFLH